MPKNVTQECCGDEGSLQTLAVINPEKCQPRSCNWECLRGCPVVKNGAHCIDIQFTAPTARISEELCIGCGACVQRCPFRAVKVVRMPAGLEKQVTHRYGPNGFKLHRLPIPRPGECLGLLGANGTGKSTALKVLSGGLRPNLGRYASPPEWPEVIKFYKGSELQRHLIKARDGSCKAVVKAQHVEQLVRVWQGTVRDVWSQELGPAAGDLPEELEVALLADREVANLSGGELQRLAIAVACTQAADLYMFDEPSSFLDVKQRLHAVRAIRRLLTADETHALLAVDHDLATLDYLCDHLCFLYGAPGGYGAVSAPYSVGQGVNLFLDGFIPSENFRFRDEPLLFNGSPEAEAEPGGAGGGTWQYPALSTTLGDAFALSAAGGDVREAEIVVLLGENGMGKTTLFRLLAGQAPPAEGTACLPRLNVSIKPQSVAVKEGSSVGGAAVKALLDKKVDPQLRDDPEWRAHVLEGLGLEDLYPKSMQHLSGGEAQRVAVALALGRLAADLYLIDEPSAHLDCEHRVAVCRALRWFVRRHRKAAFVIEHDVLMAAHLADRVIVYEGVPSVRATASGPQALLPGMNHFLRGVGVTFRKDGDTGRPRVNKENSVKDREQRAAGEYFYMQSQGAD